jgi:hypothetical protein
MPLQDENNKKGDQPMRIKTKIAILAVAVLLTFLGFNLIVSPAAVDMAKFGKLTKAETAARHVRG